MNGAMNAVRLLSADVGRLELTAVPIPEPGDGQVRIRVTGAGICGTDEHILAGDYWSRPPVTLGHEVAGIVDAVGKEVESGWIDALVAPETAFATCQRCRWCVDGRPMLCQDRLSIGSGVDGGFADAIIVPVRKLHRLPDWLDDHAAALLEPLACVCNSVLDPGRVQSGDEVLVSGVGAVGLLAAQVARASGGSVTVTGAPGDDERLELARSFGFAAYDVQSADGREYLETLSGRRSLDVVLECSGSPRAVATAFACLRPGGRLVQMGLMSGPVEVPFGEIVTKELSVTAGFGSSPMSWRRAVSLVQERLVDLVPLVSNVYPLREHSAAFDASRRRVGVKTIFDPRLD